MFGRAKGESWEIFNIDNGFDVFVVLCGCLYYELCCVRQAKVQMKGPRLDHGGYRSEVSLDDSIRRRGRASGAGHTRKLSLRLLSVYYFRSVRRGNILSWG